MIDDLKNVELIDKVGGRFKLTALIQRRMAELVQGLPLWQFYGKRNFDILAECVIC